MQNKRHVHADLITARANGAMIQYHNDLDHEWEDVVTPSWNENTEYRIKPEQKSAGQVYYEAVAGNVDHDTWNNLSQCQRDHLENIAIEIIKSFKENNLV